MTTRSGTGITTTLPRAVGRLDRVLARSPVQRLMLRRSLGRLAVLAYHDVADAERFRRQLDWLTANRRVVDLDEAVAVAEGKSPSHGATLITFDDGHPSVLEVAAPLLAERRLPAVVFVVAGLVGTDTPFWWTQVEELSSAGGRTTVAPGTGRALVVALKGVSEAARRRALDELRRSAPATVVPRTRQLREDEVVQLAASGIAVGNHSFSHPLLDRCEQGDIDREITEAHTRLTSILGTPPAAFAYPNGNVDDRVVASVRRAGYRVAFGFDHRLIRLPADDLLRISRLRVNSTQSLERFATIVSGLHPQIHQLRRRLHR